MAPSPQARRWVFTWNNYTAEDEQRLIEHFEHGDPFRYAVFGREVGDSGTPHLQGFFICTSPKRRNWLTTRFFNGCWIEPALGPSDKASEYCTKSGDYEEFGELPSEQGKRTDVDRLKEWIINHPTRPTKREVASEFFGLALRYGHRIDELIDDLRPHEALVPASVQLRPWQLDLETYLGSDPDDRSVTFYVDEEGNSGKSWFCRYWLTNHMDDTQILSIGKRDDLAYAIDVTKRYFFFDVPRCNMEFLQYSVLESLKDQIVFCNKYQSKTKVFPKPVHVIVFCNERPDYSKMTDDRYMVKNM